MSGSDNSFSGSSLQLTQPASVPPVMGFTVVPALMPPVLVDAVSSGRASGAGDCEVTEAALCDCDVVNEGKAGYYCVTIVSDIFGSFVKRDEDGLVSPVVLPELLNDVDKFPSLKFFEVYSLLKGGRSGVLGRFLNPAQVGQVMSQGVNILAMEVLLVVMEAVWVAHVWTGRCAVADRWLVHYCLPTDSTPLPGFVAGFRASYLCAVMWHIQGVSS